MSDQELYDTLFNAVKIFYDKVYKDSWLSQVFSVIDQEIIEKQQTDFMVQAFGGPKRYCGRNPKDAHMHIFVDEKMWDYREKLLEESLKEASLSQEMIDKWMKIDNAFRSQIQRVKPEDCQKRYTTDTIINIPQPIGKKVA